jgi:hypothetical protein
MHNTHSSEPQIRCRKANSWLPPLLVARFCLRGVRPDVLTLKVRERALELFIRMCEADAGSSGFGLPDDVSPAAHDLSTHDHRHGLFVKRNRRRTRRICGVSQQDLYQHIRVERDYTLHSASRSWYASSQIMRDVGSASYFPTMLETPTVSRSRESNSPRATRYSSSSFRHRWLGSVLVLPHVDSAFQPATQHTDHHRFLPQHGKSSLKLLQLILQTMMLDLKTFVDHAQSFVP